MKRIPVFKFTRLGFENASRCQQAFSKHCLVNLISKDTHLVFSTGTHIDIHVYAEYVVGQMEYSM